MATTTPAPATVNTDELRQLYEERMVKQRLKKLETENETIKAQTHQQYVQMNAQVKKQRDVIWYLNREIKTKDDTIAGLHDELQALKSKLDLNERNHEHDIACVREANDERVQALEAQLKTLQEKHDQISNFVKYKDSLTVQLEECKQRLEEESANHQKQLSELERRNVAEKNRLKKEMLRKVKETKLSLLAMTEDQLHTTTKRTILENEQITNELHFQSKMTERMVRETDELKAENQDLKRQLELREESERMLATRTHFFKKLIKKLNEKIKQLEQSDRVRSAAKQNRSGYNNAHGKESAAEYAQTLEAKVKELERENLKLQTDVSTALDETRTLRKLQATRASQQDEAITFVLSCIQDVKRKQSINAVSESRKYPPTRFSRAKPRRIRHLSDCTLGERETLLQSLLDRLTASHSDWLDLGGGGSSADATAG